jgi:putative transposase
VVRHYIDPGGPQQNAFIEDFNDSLKDEKLNEVIFDHLDVARHKLALSRFECKYVLPLPSLENQTPAKARLAFEKFAGSANDHFQTVVCKANSQRVIAQTGDEEN